MAIVIEDLQMERLAQQIATAEGISVTEVVREKSTLPGRLARPDGREASPARATHRAGARGRCATAASPIR